MEFLSSWNPSLLVRQNRPILERWASGRTDGRTAGRDVEKTIFQNPLPRLKSNKKGVEENTRAFRLDRTELIPAAFIGTCYSYVLYV